MAEIRIGYGSRYFSAAKGMGWWPKSRYIYGQQGPGIGSSRLALDSGHDTGIQDTRMSIENFIANEVKSNDVVLFMKGSPQFPQCGFSGQVVQILDHIGVAYKGLNVLESAELRDGIKTYSNWPTIPQLYVKGEFVGGCDIVREMFQAGELQQLFADKGVTLGANA
jgi:monothiol glutaredoxin